MKKFLNDPKQFVPEFLEGIQLASDGTLKYEPKYNLIYRADMPSDDKVSIIQGSGSGHEPAHTMIVGKGMLDAACPGDVFAGPPVDFVVETSKLMNSKKGILHIVNNYTGDRTACEMGRELCEAEGMRIETLLVNDDVAVKDSTWTVGRRGVAGNFFVIKAVGAAVRERRRSRRAHAHRDEGHRQRPHDGYRAELLHAADARHAALRDRRRTRWRSASGSTGSRAASAPSSSRRPRSSTCSSTRSSPTCRSRRATRSPSWSTAWVARRSPSSTSSTASPTRSWPRRASRSSAATSASTAPRSRWQARTSRSSRWTTRSRSSSSPRRRSSIRVF